MKETSLYWKIRKTGEFRDHKFFYEVPTGDWTESRKSIDMITFRDGNVIAIEVKVRDWKTALRQAFSNLFVANYCYVALWHEYMQNVDERLFRKTGIGLLEVNGNCELRISADKSTYVIPQKRNYVINVCKKRGGSPYG